MLYKGIDAFIEKKVIFDLLVYFKLVTKYNLVYSFSLAFIPNVVLQKIMRTTLRIFQSRVERKRKFLWSNGKKFPWKGMWMGGDLRICFFGKSFVSKYVCRMNFCQGIQCKVVVQKYTMLDVVEAQITNPSKTHRMCLLFGWLWFYLFL